MTLRAVLAATGLSALAFAAAACGGDDGGTTSGKTVDEVRAALDEELAAEKAGDPDKFLKHVTDKFLKTVQGITREEAKADPSTFQSDDQPTIEKITVSGNKATIAITGGFKGGLDYNVSATAVKEGGEWRIDELHVKSADKIPSGAKKVNLDLTDFAFGFTRKDVTSKDIIALHVENKGKQPHMVGLAKIPDNADLQKFLHEDNPQGLEEIGTAFLFAPGDKADVVIKEKLAPGRYVMLCYVSDQDDPKHTPHFEKGMVADFKVE